jgi:proteasome accessory factor B
MQKDQRLLDLAALLLKAAEPVSWREIQEQFPEDYSGKGEAAIRKFERDKAELLELGIPVRYAAGDEDLPAGYHIDKDEFYLPDLKLPPEDLALLYLAGSAALAQGTFPYAKDLAHALNKLSFAASAPGASEAAAQATRRLSEEEAGAAPLVVHFLEELSRAIAHRKRVHLRYRGAERREDTERDVEPYGLFQKGGAWYLAGYCLLREDIRTFHLSRIVSLAVNPSAPRTPDFSPRKDIALAELAAREPWEFRVHPQVRCRVLLDTPVSEEVLASFGPRRKVKDEEGGVVVEVDATNSEGLLRHVLSLGDSAEILAPRSLRERAREALSALAEGLG